MLFSVCLHYPETCNWVLCSSLIKSYLSMSKHPLLGLCACPHSLAYNKKQHLAATAVYYSGNLHLSLVKLPIQLMPCSSKMCLWCMCDWKMTASSKESTPQKESTLQLYHFPILTLLFIIKQSYVYLNDEALQPQCPLYEFHHSCGQHHNCILSVF